MSYKNTHRTRILTKTRRNALDGRRTHKGLHMTSKHILLASAFTALTLAACGAKDKPKDAAAPAAAADAKTEAKVDPASGPAIIFDAGGKFDKS